MSLLFFKEIEAAKLKAIKDKAQELSDTIASGTYDIEQCDQLQGLLVRIRHMEGVEVAQ